MMRSEKEEKARARARQARVMATGKVAAAIGVVEKATIGTPKAEKEKERKK